VIIVDTHARATATGVIDGRVLEGRRRRWQVSRQRRESRVEGSSLEAVSDDYGYFEIRSVPAGKATRKAILYSGQTPHDRYQVRNGSPPARRTQ